MNPKQYVAYAMNQVGKVPGVEPDLPGRDVTMVAPAVNLVAGPELHPALIDLLLQAAAKIHADGDIISTAGMPSKQFLDFPLNKNNIFIVSKHACYGIYCNCINILLFLRKCNS